MINNIIQAVLDYRFVNTAKVWQYDYGKILRIKGENLPGTAEVHFSLNETGGDAITKVGVTTDGVTEVQVPDELLENGDTTFNYNIMLLYTLKTVLPEAQSIESRYQCRQDQNRVITSHRTTQTLIRLEMWSRRSTMQQSVQQHRSRMQKSMLTMLARAQSRRSKWQQRMDSASWK